MSATQPLFSCPEASGGLRLVLETPCCPSPLHLVTLALAPGTLCFHTELSGFQEEPP